MLKTLFFSMLLHLGWADQQASWVNRVNPRELTQAAQLVQTFRRAPQVPPEISYQTDSHSAGAPAASGRHSQGHATG